MSTLTAPEPVAAVRSGNRPFWLLLWALYTTQFIGASFLSTGLVGILRDGGTDLGTLGMLQLLALVWPLKFLWAPLLDRWSPARSRGHYRTWLLVLQPLMVLSLLAMAVFSDPQDGLGTIILLAAAFVLFSATQDIAADALSVRGLEPEQHDLGAGVQVGASYIGTVVGGGLALLVYDAWGWRAAVVMLAACTAVAMVPVLRHREQEYAPVETRPAALSRMFGVLSVPGGKRWALVAVPLVALGSAAVWSLVTPALVDAGWSLGFIGTVTSVIAAAPALAAALMGGRLCRTRGRGTTLLIGAAIQLFGGICFVPVVWSGAELAHGMQVLLGIVGACCVLAGYTVMNTGIYAVNLGIARPGHAGADFTLLSSISMLGGTIGASAGLFIADAGGYGTALVFGLLVAVAGVVACRTHPLLSARR
ncbi:MULTISPECIES: MFS transporter [Kocuria]|uniref:MFS transporter n=1 Tax=Kocuria TaxID=57493 RepID=UPI00057DFE9A|nr:MFS transporter [Kocuria rhizophila]KIC70611.1 MFS transporter [Kocuria rhizophila]KUP27478.1 MFS transporter [Kocuria rhizophila]MXN62290.1 MFS transporter [Bacillus sp. BGMRC0062]WIW68689.1 MFS transporter [Kocuria sp. ChxB]